MIEIIINNELWSQLLRFLIGSSILLSAAWAADMSGLVASFRNRAYIWKSAVFASLLLLFPLLNTLAPVQLLGVSKQPISAPAELAADNVVIATPNQVQPVLRNTLANSSPFPLDQAETALANQVSAIQSPQPSQFDAADNLPGSNTSTISTSRWILLFWGLCSFLALLRLGIRYWLEIRSLGQRTEIDKGNPIFPVLETVCKQAGVETCPKLTYSAHTATPLSLLGNEICLPNWVDRSLPFYELRSILAHEVGHIKNRDMRVLLGLQLLVCVFFFQPLFFQARKRLIDIFEFLADETALKQCSKKSELAETLINCADKIHQRQSTQWGFAMVGSTSRLKLRLQQLGKEESKSHLRSDTLTRFGTYAVVLSVLFLVPIFKYDYAAELTSTVDDDNSSAGRGGFLSRILGSFYRDSSYEVLGDKHRWRWDEGSAEWQGDLVFDYSNGVSIVAISNDGQFDYRTLNSNPQRRIQFVADGSELLSNYWLDGKDTSLDADGREWLQSILVQLLRSTGIDAEARVTAMLEQAGADQLIAELAYIDSDHVNRLYNQFMLANSQLDEDQIHRLLQTDKSVSSDLEMRLILTSLIQTQILSVANQPLYLALAETISSDLELRILLATAAEHADPSPGFIQQLIQATSTISSDLEQRLALSQIVDNATMNEDSWRTLHKVAEFVSSDLELRLLLGEMAKRADQNEQSTWYLIDSSDSISSDLEHRLALTTIAEHGVMSDENWTEAFRVSQNISSDLEARLLLGNFSQLGDQSTIMTQLALDYLNTISSDVQMRLAVTSIIENGNMTEQNWITAISQVNKHISSELEKSLALNTIRTNLPDNDVLKARLFDSMPLLEQ